MKVFKTLFAALLLTGVASSTVPVAAQQAATQAPITKTQMQTAITNYAASQTEADQEAKYESVLRLVFGVLAERKAIPGGLVEGSTEYIAYMKLTEKYNQLVLKKRAGVKTEIVTAMNAFVASM